MKIAVIDCGTNTFNLIISQVDHDKVIAKLKNDRISVRLGEGGINSGLIAETPYQRGIKAMEQFKEQLAAFQVDQVLAFATSAIRDAKNGQDFVKEVFQKTGIQIEIIDGYQEADLIYKGNAAALKLGKQTSLIMDIGGGSNEFILCNKQEVFWKGSFRVGAARLLEMFPHSNPILKSEMAEIQDFLKGEMAALFIAVNKYPPSELIGSSGAFDSIVEMIQCELNGPELKESVTEYIVDLDKYQQISERVLNSNIEQRKKIKGLVPMRIDMIVISCMMIDQILSSFHIKQMRVSTYSLKEGALINYLQKLN